MDHNKALHITVQWIDKVISRVMADGGSRVNICSFSTLREFGIHVREVKESHVRVRAFDGSHKDVIGKIYLALLDRHVEFSVYFN